MPRQTDGISYTPQWNFLGTGDSTTLQSYNSLNGTYSLILTEPLADLRYAPIAGGSGYVPYTGATADLVLGAHIVSAQGFAITGIDGLGYINMPPGGDDTGVNAIPTPASGVNVYSRRNNEIAIKGTNGHTLSFFTQFITGSTAITIPDGINGSRLATIDGGQTFTSAIWNAGAVTVNNAVARIYDSAEDSELILSHNGIIARSPVGTPAVLQLMGAGGDIRVNETKGDNQGVYWDATNNEFRIGYKPETYNPILGGDATLSLIRQGAHNKIRMTTYGSSTNFLAWNKTEGTQASPTAVSNGAVFGSLVSVGYTASATPALSWAHGAEYRQLSTGTWGDTQNPGGHHWRTAKLGELTQTDAMGLGMSATGVDLELYAGDLIVNHSGDAIAWTKNGTVNAYLVANSTGSDYGIVGTSSNHPFVIRTNNTDAINVATNGNTVVAGTLSASNLSGTNTGDQTTITGNAGTATALQNSRTIWGQSFNGSANVSGAFSGATTGSFSTSLVVGAGTGNIPLQINGGTGSGNGSYVAFRRDSVDKGYFGSDAALHANNTDDITISTTADFNLRVGGGFPKRFNISASTGLIQLPAYTTPGVLTNDASGNITSTALTSGTYTPTATNISNVSSSTPVICNYFRVGDMVTVTGRIEFVNTGATTGTTIELTLPIASNFGAYTDCSGVGQGTPNITNGITQIIFDANASNDKATLNCWANSYVGSQIAYFTFTYKVI